MIFVQILPGNNSRVIMQSMKRRPWWNAIVNGDPDENIADQQPTFLWEMYRISARYNGQFKHTLLNHIQRNALLTSKYDSNRRMHLDNCVVIS